MREAVVEPELGAAADDVGLAERDERRVNPEARALDAVAGAEVRDTLEGGDELGPAVGIAGVVERVDADHDVVRAEHFGPSHRERQEDRVARRHVGGRDRLRVEVASARDVEVRGERRSADRPKVEIHLEMPLDAERARDRARRVDLARVPLAVVDRQREQREALALGDRRGGVRIESPAQEDDGAHARSVRRPACQDAR